MNRGSTYPAAPPAVVHCPPTPPSPPPCHTCSRPEPPAHYPTSRFLSESTCVKEENKEETGEKSQVAILLLLLLLPWRSTWPRHDCCRSFLSVLMGERDGAVTVTGCCPCGRVVNSDYITMRLASCIAWVIGGCGFGESGSIAIAKNTCPSDIFSYPLATSITLTVQCVEYSLIYNFYIGKSSTYCP